MFEIKGMDIEITRGDTAGIRYIFKDKEIPYGTDAIFTVKKKVRDKDIVFQKRVDASGGSASIFFTSDDTNIDPRTYYWDIRLQVPREEGGYDVQTPMEYASFTILDVVGGDIGSGNSESVNPDLPVLQIVLEETREVLARADMVVSSLEALTVEAEPADEPEAEVVKREDGSLSIRIGLPRGAKGDRGEQGIQGERGVQGERGAAFTYDDFTEEQLESIRGPQGLTGEQGIQGVPGKSFTYDDFTPEQLESLRGPQGERGEEGPRGERGAAFTYNDFTADQLEQLRGPKGERGEAGADGTSFTVLGMYATYAALIAAHPTADAGDAYAVGTSESNVVYVWDADKGEWTNLGALKGPKGDPGSAGANGSNGVSVTHSWSGTVLTVTSASGTSSANLKGDKGDTGAAGSTGKDGAAGVGISNVEQTTTSTADGGTNVVTVTLTDGTKKTFNVKNGSKGSAGTNGSNGSNGADGVSVQSVVQTTTSTADGGNNVVTVTLSNGTQTTFTVKNGSKGSTGAAGSNGSNGADGYTPVKGTDYYTAADKSEMVGEVTAALEGTLASKLSGKMVTVTLSSSSWSGSSTYTQTVNVSGVTTSSALEVGPDSSTFEAYCEAQVRASAQGNGTVTFTASAKPSTNLNAVILILEGVQTA